MPPRRNAGFSIAELMVCFGVVGILLVLGSQKLRLFMMRAQMAEAISSLRYAEITLRSYMDEQSLDYDTFPPAAYGNGTSGLHFIIAPDISTMTSCNNANVYGIKSADCRKIRYSVDVAGDPSDQGFTIHARNIAGRVCPPANADEWVAIVGLDHRGQMPPSRGPCHIIDATKTDCAEYDASNVQWTKCGYAH